MSSDIPAARVSKGALWTGRIISAVPSLMLLMSCTMIFMKVPDVAKGMEKYGYPSHALMPLAIVQLLCVVLYVIPQTSVFGAILMTGYLGGAVATHVRASEPFYFAIIVGVLVWLGLLLRDKRLQKLLPFRR